jgi:hypothetical protein
MSPRVFELEYDVKSLIKTCFWGQWDSISSMALYSLLEQKR